MKPKIATEPYSSWYLWKQEKILEDEVRQAMAKAKEEYLLAIKDIEKQIKGSGELR